MHPCLPASSPRPTDLLCLLYQRFDLLNQALDGFDVSREQAEAMIMAAREAVGWIEPQPAAAEGDAASAAAGATH